jgi:hypothetical protein
MKFDYAFVLRDTHGDADAIQRRVDKALNEAEARGRKAEGNRAVAILRNQAKRVRPGTLVSYHIAAEVLEIELKETSPLGSKSNGDRIEPWMEEVWFIECPKCRHVHDLGTGVCFSKEEMMTCDGCEYEFTLAPPTN